MSDALGKRIRELRIAKGLTLRAFARMAGVSPPFMSDLEHGRRSTNKLAAMAAILDTSLDELQALEGRVDPDLAKWVAANPGLVALLRSMRSCRRCRGRGGPLRAKGPCHSCGCPPITLPREEPPSR